MPSWSSNRVRRLTEVVRKSSDLADALGADARIAGMRWQRFGGRAAFHGIVSTVRCPQSVGLIRQCIDEPGAGRVLVVDVAGGVPTAVLGDRMASIALRNGWAGFLIEGAVRDVDALRGMDLGVFALGAVPRRASLELTGERDVTVTLGELQVRPGDYIVCDADGVLVCAPDAALRLAA